MKSLTIVIDTTKDTTQFAKSAQPTENLNRLVNLISGLNCGALKGEIRILSEGVKASGTFTLTSAIATDAVTIAGVTLTASAAPANENQWLIDGYGTDAEEAEILADCINAHSTLSKVVEAEAASNVVTVQAVVAGEVGNQITISSADATIVASGANLTGGTSGSNHVVIGK